MEFRDIVTLAFLIAAVWAIRSAIKEGDSRQLIAGAVLGAVAGAIFTFSADPHLRAILPPGGSNPPATGSFTQAPPHRYPEATSAAPHSADDERTVSPPLPVPTSSPPPPSSIDAAPRSRNALADENGGGVDVEVVGTLSGLEVEHAVIAALQDAGWRGLDEGARKSLRISGSVRDLDLTLGQLPTAAVSLHWQLRSVSTGRTLAQGAVSDQRGVGSEQESARLEAVQRAAAELAARIGRTSP
jgi:hypothetical protein